MQKNVKNRLFIQIPPVVYMLLLIILVFSMVNTRFFSFENFRNIFIQSAPLMIMAFGQTMIILTANIDLSINATVNITTVIVVFLTSRGFPIGIAIGLAVGIAMVIGICNGVLVSKLKLPAFIVTYGMQNIINSIALLITGGASIYFASSFYQLVTVSTFIFIPITIWVVIAVFLVAYITLNMSKLGMHIRALGGNPEALTLTGVHCAKPLVQSYAYVGVLAGIAGVITLCRVESGQPVVANGWEFQAVAATVLGGTTFREGKGGLLGTVFGVLLIQVIQNGLNVIGVQSIYQSVMVGSIVLAAIIIDALARRWTNS